MSGFARREAILEKLRATPKVMVRELAQLFPDVTPTTIRRDLSEMEREGVIKRSYGEVHLIAEDKPVSPVRARNTLFAQEKDSIAQKAAELVQDGMSIFLDAGTTALALATKLRNRKITVVTNSIDIVCALAHCPSINLISCGGMIESSNMCFVGPDTESFLRRIQVDLVFVGASGVREGIGFTCSSPLQYSAKQQMLLCGKKKYALIDTSKLCSANLYVFAHFEQVDGIFINQPAPHGDEAGALEKLKETGVPLFFAEKPFA